MRGKPRANTCARAVAAAAVLAACSDGDARSCDARFSGNFQFASTSASNCPLVTSTDTGVALTFALASRDLDAPLAISIDLGASPAPGAFSDADGDSWSALATRTVGSGACVYSAGDHAVPTGSYVLMLAAIELSATGAAAGVAHGALSVVQYVQAQPGVDCGAGDNETVDVAF